MFQGPPDLTYPLLGIFASLCLLWIGKRYSKGTLPLPPGPKPLPIVGNSFGMPNAHPEKTFDEWSQKYGEVHMFGILPGILR